MARKRGAKRRALRGGDGGLAIALPLAAQTYGDSRKPQDLHGTTMSQLIAAMKSGGAYVNVHTTTHPDGEIRGDIQSATSSTLGAVTH